MLLKQISVFAENRRGAIMDITGVLFNAGVNLRAISIADTTDFGVVRLIVDKRKEALAALRENGMTVKETDVVALAVDDTPGAFHNALKALTESGVMVEYSYG
ncbi:MAG: acetolactate synthase, partial [Oscillospiraceae bacterium]